MVDFYGYALDGISPALLALNESIDAYSHIVAKRKAEEMVERVKENISSNPTAAMIRPEKTALIILGYMYSSVMKTQIGPGEYLVSVPTDYAALVEFGTSHSRAFPFFSPAIESVSSSLTEGSFLDEIMKSSSSSIPADITETSTTSFDTGSLDPIADAAKFQSQFN